MSQKLSLVKFEIEDEIPIDETSQRIKSAYIPNEFVDYLAQRKLSSEIEIKESRGVSPDIPVVFIENIDKSINEVDARLAEFVRASHGQVCGELLVAKEIDKCYRDLLTWLKIRELFKLKQEKYIEDPQFKLVVG